MSTPFLIEVISKSLENYAFYDLPVRGTDCVFVVAEDYSIDGPSIVSEYRFKLPLVEFNIEFIEAMNQIIADRYEAGTMFKMVVENGGRVGFFAIVQTE